MRIHTKFIGLFTVILSILMLLAACGNSNESSKPKNDQEKDTALTDAMGKVTIPADTKRILAPYMEDSLVALGITPAAQWSIGTAVLDYLQTDLKDVPKISWDLPLEQTIEANPDLIIFSSKASIQKGQYEEYKKIAPTYVYKDEDSSNWKKQLQVMGKIVGKQQEAEDRLSGYEEKTKKASEDIKKAIGGQSASIIWVAGDQYYLFENTRFAANVLYGDLGVTQPQMVKNLPEAKASWQPLSLESLSELDADHLFLVSKPGEAGLTKLKESSVFKGLSAAKQGHVYDMEDPSHWTINGVIANELTIDQITKSLAK